MFRRANGASQTNKATWVKGGVVQESKCGSWSGASGTGQAGQMGNVAQAGGPEGAGGAGGANGRGLLPNADAFCFEQGKWG